MARLQARQGKVYTSSFGAFGMVVVSGPTTTCKACHRLLHGATPYLCGDCLASIHARKRAARKKRKQGKVRQRTQAFEEGTPRISSPNATDAYSVPSTSLVPSQPGRDDASPLFSGLGSHPTPCLKHDAAAVRSV